MATENNNTTSEQETAPLQNEQTAAELQTQPEKETTDNVATDSEDYSEGFKAKIIVVTSGKGGVGKTTSSAAISSGLALKGFKTVVIDFDVGLRNQIGRAHV